MLEIIRRLAIPVAVASLATNFVMLVVSIVLWWLAIAHGWVHSVAFVSHVSMLALVFAAVSGLAAAVAGILALFPTKDILGDENA